jgi:thioredoxin reductase (NADPH)
MTDELATRERAPSEEPAPERRPVILSVDDDPSVLAAVSRDLRRGFGERFRIMRATSGAEALEILRQLRTRGDQVALLIADQRMPAMAGTEFLTRALEIVPGAKRVLLTAYADTNAAIAAINEAALDYYLLKPWDPPEEQLFPVLDDLLTTWEAGAFLETGGVRLIGHRFSKATHDLRDFLARNGVPARWLDVERDGEARELLQVIGVDETRLPVALLEDGGVLEQPTILELAGRLGITARPTQDHYDLVIVGGGPAGLAAAVYGASEGLRTVLVESEATGGQAGQSSRIENYLGFPAGLSGSDLARRATDQARRLGAELLTVQDAVGLRVEGAGRMVELSGGGDAERELRVDRLGRRLPPDRRTGLREVHRRRRLLRLGAHRGALVCGPACRHRRGRELGGAGRGLLQQLRLGGHDARARALTRALDVELPDRAARGSPQRDGAHGELGGGSRG